MSADERRFAQVTSTLEDRRPGWDYQLLPGDVLRREADGTWWKVAPGLAVGGFELSAKDEATLIDAIDTRWEIVGLQEYGEWCLSSGGDNQ